LTTRGQGKMGEWVNHLKKLHCN